MFRLTAGIFLLLGQKKGTKEKATLCAGPSRSEGLPCAAHQSARLRNSPCGLRQCSPSARASAALLGSATRGPKVSQVTYCLAARACFSPSPLGGEGRDEGSAPSAELRLQAKTGVVRSVCLSAQREFTDRPVFVCNRRQPEAQRRADAAGWLFLWLLSFGQAKESSTPSGGTQRNSYSRKRSVINGPPGVTA